MTTISKIERPPEASAESAPRRKLWHTVAWVALPIALIAGPGCVLHSEGPAIAAMPMPRVSMAGR